MKGLADFNAYIVTFSEINLSNGTQSFSQFLNIGAPSAYAESTPRLTVQPVEKLNSKIQTLLYKYAPELHKPLRRYFAEQDQIFMFVSPPTLLGGLACPIIDRYSHTLL